MSATDLTVRLGPELIFLLDKVAAARDLSREQLLARMVEKQVRDEAEFIDFVRVGIDDLDAGRSISHEELVSRLKARQQARRAA